MLLVEYISLVRLDYEKKRESKALAPSLIRPSPAKLKRECLAVCDERYDRKDEKMLRDFFGKGGDKIAWLQAIKRCDRDRFRPLVNFIKGSIDLPADKNIELLAWLIDYQGRPCEYGPYSGSDGPGIAYTAGSRQTSEKPGEFPHELSVDQEEKKDPSTIKSKKDSSNARRIKIIVTVTIVLAAAGIYWLSRGAQACMYWAGDHFQQVSCSKKFDDTLVIGLNTEKLIHFKKITRPDTITENSIGKVWYVKYNGNYEFYTDSGSHPIDPELRLKPITGYIIRNHTPPEQ